MYRSLVHMYKSLTMSEHTDFSQDSCKVDCSIIQMKKQKHRKLK